MKFKKTKLTALTLSVLMAASTITSVTWAADLFTDGVPAEVAVEAPLTTEEVNDGSEESLLANPGQVIGVTEIKFHYNTNRTSVVVDYKIQVEGTDPNSPVTLESDPKTNQATTPIKTLEADCENPERNIYSFTYTDQGGETYTYRTDSPGVDISECDTVSGDTAGYIINPSSEKLGHIWSKEVSKIIQPATCSTPGVEYLYPGCEREGCKKYSADDRTYYDVERGFNESHEDVIVKTISTVAHSPKATPVNVTPEYARLHRVNADKLPVNCHYDQVKGAFVLDDENGTENAYYYTVVECSICGEPIDDTYSIHWLRDVDGTVEGTYYEEGDNVLGFAKINSNGVLELVKFGTNGSRKISVTDVLSDPVIPILRNCDKPGYYYKREYHKGDSDPVKSERIEVTKGHTWGSAEVNLKSDKTEVAKLGYEKFTDDDGNNIPLVKRDALGNVIEAKSKDCVTTAKYALYHMCLNPNCKKTESYGDVKEAPFNLDAHQFSAWTEQPDEDETTYTDSKDGLHHIKHLYISQTCQLCFIKKTRPYDNVEEEHTLKDKKIDGTEVEATCGTPGSYQSALTCACGYMDEKSVTDVIVPATDNHDFGTNEAELVWTGEAFIDGNGTKPAKRHLVACVVRKCNVCGLLDSNGINGELAGANLGGTPIEVKVDQKSIVDAKKDPTTGITYPCSTAHATVYVDWVGIVDGKAAKLSEKRENVPYYASVQEYQGRTAHHAAPTVRENIVAPTDTAEGSYDEVIYCEVCGDEMSRKTTKVSKLDPAIVLDTPAVLSAESAGYNSIKVTWSAVEGAASYRLYYRGGEATNWTRVKSGIKGTAYTYTSSNLVSGVKYRFTVRAVSGDVLSGYSAKGKVAAPKPAAPTVKSVAFSGSKATVTWSKVAGANGYIIQRKTTGGWTRVGTVKSGSKVTWTDKKAVSGATYRVRAYRTVENVNVYGPFSAAK